MNVATAQIALLGISLLVNQRPLADNEKMQ